MLANVRVRLEELNNVSFTSPEWQRFILTYLDSPSDGIIDKTRKVHDDYIHDFVFDDGRIQNIYLFDKSNVARNKLQVIKQFEQTGLHANRYDVTILVNGLPLVQIEIKRRGVAKRYVTNSIKREFASENGNDLKDTLPKMSPLNPEYLKKKSSVFQKVSDFVAKFKGVGGNL